MAADADPGWGLDRLTDELPPEAAEYLSGMSPGALPDTHILPDLAEALRQKMKEELSRVSRTAAVMLIVSAIISLANVFDASGRGTGVILLSGVTAIGAAALGDLDSCLHLGVSSLESVAGYAQVLLPVLVSVSAAAGSPGAAAVKYAATSFFMELLLRFAHGVISPCICACAAAAVADAAVGNSMLKTVKRLIKRGTALLLSGLSLAFTAWLTLSGVVADTADSLTVRAAKTGISAVLPVVGSILADAAGALTSAAALLRGTVGVFGVLAVMAVCLGPFASLGVRYMVFKLSAAVCGCVSDRRITELLDDIGSCFGMMLGLNGAGALMMFLSIYSLIRTAGS